jgi:hypothetical protein
MGEEEQELTGGNASGTVVQVGGTVRKPWIENTSSMETSLAFKTMRWRTTIPERRVASCRTLVCLFVCLFARSATDVLQILQFSFAAGRCTQTRCLQGALR